MVNKFKSLNDNELNVSGGLDMSKIVQVAALMALGGVGGMIAVKESDKVNSFYDSTKKKGMKIFEHIKNVSGSDDKKIDNGHP